MLLLNPNDFNGNKIIHPDFKGKYGMFIVVADWCHFCRMMKEPWIQFRKIAGDDFIIASVDSVKYPKLSQKLNVTGFPTIFSVNSKGKYSKYTGSRDIFELTNVLCDTITSHPLCKN